MRTACLFLCCLVLAAPCSRADRGSIAYEAGAEIFEPNQLALIAWNGEEEILILSTDLRASKPTKVLEVLPLPSEPVVKEGDVEIFRRATDLLNSKRPLVRVGGGSRGVGDDSSTFAGQVTFHQVIGAHDISVARVVKPEGFIDWVEKRLRADGADGPQIPPVLKASVVEYLKEGFTWFVFDTVSLDTKPKTNQAIQYRFATKRLFYPMKISRTNKGDTDVDLLVLSPTLLSEFPGIPVGKVRPRHIPVTVSAKEVRGVSAEIDDLLGHRDGVRLRIWRISGSLSSFDRDLIAMPGGASRQ